MRRTPTLRLTAEWMAEQLERVGDLQSIGDPREIAAVIQQAQKWLPTHFQLKTAFNRLSSAGSIVASSPNSPARWQDVANTALHLAAAFKKLGDEYLDLCDVDRRDGKKCATVVPPGVDHCPQERLHS